MKGGGKVWMVLINLSPFHICQVKWMFTKRNYISGEIRKNWNQNSLWQLMTAESLTTANLNRLSNDKLANELQWFKPAENNRTASCTLTRLFFICQLHSIYCKSPKVLGVLRWCQCVLSSVIVTFVEVKQPYRTTSTTNPRLDYHPVPRCFLRLEMLKVWKEVFASF